MKGAPVVARVIEILKGANIGPDRVGGFHRPAAPPADPRVVFFKALIVALKENGCRDLAASVGSDRAFDEAYRAIFPE